MSHPSRCAYRAITNGFAAGSLSLLATSPVVVYASRKIPLSVLDVAERTVSAMASRGIVLAGGWQSRLEKRLLRKILTVPDGRAVYVLAKGICHFQLPAFGRESYIAGRLLVLSPFENERRISRRLVMRRDVWIRNQFDRYLFCSIDPGGNVEHVLDYCIQGDKTVYILDHPMNTEFLAEGSRKLSPYNIQEVFFS